MKKRVERRKPRTIKDLEEMASEEWEKIDKELLIRLIGTMPRRLSQCIERKGECIEF